MNSLFKTFIKGTPTFKSSSAMHWIGFLDKSKDLRLHRTWKRASEKTREKLQALNDRICRFSRFCKRFLGTPLAFNVGIFSNKSSFNLQEKFPNISFSVIIKDSLLKLGKRFFAYIQKTEFPPQKNKSMLALVKRLVQTSFIIYLFKICSLLQALNKSFFIKNFSWNKNIVKIVKTYFKSFYFL